MIRGATILPEQAALQRQQIIAEVLKGYALDGIAKEFGVRVEAISRMLSKENITRVYVTQDELRDLKARRKANGA